MAKQEYYLLKRVKQQLGYFIEEVNLTGYRLKMKELAFAGSLR